MCTFTAAAQRYVPPRPSRSFTLYGGPWRTDGQFDSIVHIKVGASGHVLSIVPTLYLADGTAVALPAVVVPPMGNADLDIGKALAAQPAGGGWLWGSIGLSYRAPIAYVKATLEIADGGSSGLAEAFSPAPSPRRKPLPLGPMPDNIAPAMAKKYARALLRQQNRARAAALSADPQPYEALWSKATATTSAWFALSNVTGDTTSVDYFVTGAQGTRIAGSGVTLAPHATSTISLEPLISQLPEAERQAGGLEIDPHAPSGATLIAGALQDPASDTSLSLQFLRRGRAFGPPGLGRLAVVGLPVGAPPADFGLPQDVTFAPEVSLRNTTGAPLPVAVRLEITAGTSNPAPLCKFELPVTLAPRQERDVALGPSLATEKCAASGMINLVASFRGHRGDLEMEAHSTDSSGVYTVDAELHALDNIFKPATGLERWTNAGGQTTLITLWNPSSQAQQLRLEFTGGAGLTMRVVHSNRICDQCYFLPLALPANGSVTLSTAELRASAPPDRFGRSFPAAPRGSLK
ncbi:MAG: hypothetical protein ACRD1A_07540, partial [Terriglobales bacterium]